MGREEGPAIDDPQGPAPAAPSWLPVGRLGQGLRAIVSHGARPGLALRVGHVLDEVPGVEFVGLRLPGGLWDHPAGNGSAATIARLDAGAEMAGGRADDHAPFEIAGLDATALTAYRFGTGDRPGLLVVSSAGPPDAVAEAALGVLAAALDETTETGRTTAGEAGRATGPHPPGAPSSDRVGAAVRELARVIVEETGLDGVAAALGQALDAPAAVWGADGAPAASYGATDAVPTLQRHIERSATDVPVVVGEPAGWTHARVVHEGQLVAAVGSRVTGGDPDVDALLTHAALIAAAELVRRRDVAAAELQVWGQLASEVLFEADRDVVRRHAASVRYDLDAPHRVLVVSCARQAERILPVIRGAASYLDLGTPVAVDGDRVALLCRHDGPWNEITKAVTGEIGTSCRAGLSSQAPGIEAPTLFAEADLACAVGQAVGGPTITRFEDLGLLRLLAAAGKPAQIVEYVERNLGVLLEYDETHHSSLVQSLCTYLDTGASLRAASDRLMIHESTLKYRLHRIQALSSHDLSDPETRFNLHLACRAHEAARILRSLGSDDSEVGGAHPSVPLDVGMD